MSVTPYAVATAVKAICTVRLTKDDATTAHKAVMSALSRAGFGLTSEYPVDGGMVDVLATLPGSRIAIEIDRERPRIKSLRKLRAFEGGRILVLRGYRPDGTFDGIDAIIGLRGR